MSKCPPARKNIQDLKPYSSARNEYSGSGGILLDANENSIGSVLENGLNRYPDPLQKELKSVIAAQNKISPENIFIGNGSDEAIDLLIRAYCEPGVDRILIFPPTYGIYSVFANINNVGITTLPLNESFQLDMDGYQKVEKRDIKIIFICSPNNPSGNLLKQHDILAILNSVNSLVVVDEAYIDFADDQGFVERMKDFPNLVVLQTMSKAWGLAGIRLGLAFAHPEVIDILNKIKYPYNISRVTQKLALEAMQSTKQKDSYVKQLLTQKKYLESELNKLKIVNKIFPSDANFLLVRFDNARLIFSELLERQIIVRDRSGQINCADCLRITIGNEAENKKLIDALKELED